MSRGAWLVKQSQEREFDLALTTAPGAGEKYPSLVIQDDAVGSVDAAVQIKGRHAAVAERAVQAPIVEVAGERKEVTLADRLVPGGENRAVGVDRDGVDLS